MAATKRVRRLRNRKVKARGWVQSWMLKLRASAMGRMARTTRPQPSAAPRLHSRVAVGRRGRPRTWRRGSRRLGRVCRTEKRTDGLHVEAHSEAASSASGNSVSGEKPEDRGKEEG